VRNMVDQRIRSKVLATVGERKDQMIEFLQDLVRVPSVMVTPGEKKCQELVADRLRRIGCDVDVWEPDWEEIKRAVSKETGESIYLPVETWMPTYEGFENRPNVVGVLKGPGEGRSLLMNGHVDVVPPGLVEKWKHDPWGASIEGDLLYGRGSVDMKAGLAAMILAVECIVSAGIRLKGDVVLESVIDEETGGNGTLACILRGYRADAGIFTEPTELEICTAHSGAQFFRISVPGKMVHIGYKDDGINAIEKAMKIIDTLKDWEHNRTTEGHERYPKYRRYQTPFPLVCGAINAGSEMLIPECPAELCVLEGAYQSMPDERIEEVNMRLKDFVLKAASTDPWLRDHPPQVEFIGLCYEGARIDPDHALMQTLSESYRQTLNKQPRITAFPTGCDMRLYTNHGGTPSLIFGPGSARRAHFVDECVSIEQYLDAIKILALTTVDWCRYEG
jgi:acetylornithine deacetylase